MHYIQKYVLSRLAKLDNCRYRDIKPKDVEGNLFAYHLAQLMKQGLVQHQGNYYSLTAAGMRHVDQLSSLTEQPRIQPKIVTQIACQNSDGEWLLYRRNRQPFKGMIGFPYGKIHLGETIQVAANRELKEKSGLTANLTHIGEAYVISYEQDQLVSHMLFHIFLAKDFRGNLTEEGDYGQFFWQKITPTKADQYFPGFIEIYQAISTKHHPFFLEVKKQL